MVKGTAGEHSKNKNAISIGGVVILNYKIRELEKEIRKTKSPKRRRDLYKHLIKLKRKEQRDARDKIQKNK